MQAMAFILYSDSASSHGTHLRSLSFNPVHLSWFASNAQWGTKLEGNSQMSDPESLSIEMKNENTDH